MNILFIGSSIILLLTAILIVAFMDERNRRRERRVAAKMDRYWGGSDRRKFVRMDASLRVDYKFDGRKCEGEVDCATKDISEGGMGVLISEKFKEGSILKLDIALPDERRTISAKGRVAWVKEAYTDGEGKKNFDAGIEFLHIEERDKARLISYLKDAGKIER